MGALIDSGFGNYTGTTTKVPQSFDLSSNNISIFEQEFNSEDSNVVSLGRGPISLKNCSKPLRLFQSDRGVNQFPIRIYAYLMESL